MANNKRRLAFGFVGVSLAAMTLAITGCLQTAAQHNQTQSLLFSTFDVSPDGKTIVFSGNTTSGSNLFLLDLATSKVTRLTNTPGYENYPAFSPDGKYLIYQSMMGLDQPRHLFLRSLDNKHVRQLTNTPATNDESPSFSPDGKKIAFSRSKQYVAGVRGEDTWTNFDVYVVNRDGSRLVQVTHLNSAGMIRPKFYPDNRHVLFEKTVIVDTPDSSSSSEKLARADTSGREAVQDVSRFSEFDSNPHFYPNGKQIVFCGNFNGTLDLYRVSLTGGKPSKLLSGQSNTGFCNPVVTHDGKNIYCLERYDPNLYQMNSDGSGLHQIADSSLFSDPMHWKPK